MSSVKCRRFDLGPIVLVFDMIGDGDDDDNDDDDDDGYDDTTAVDGNDDNAAAADEINPNPPLEKYFAVT